MTRIAVSTLIVIPGKSGSNESYLVNLIRALARLDRSNQYILFVTRQNEHLFNEAGPNFASVRVRVGSSRLLRILFEQFVLPFRARRLGADVLHYPGTVGSVLHPRKPRQVVTVHYDIDDAHAQSVSWPRKIY